MVKKIQTKLIVSIILIVFSMNSILFTNNYKVSGKEFYLTLEAKTFRSYTSTDLSNRPSYLNLIKQQLARIGINVEINVMDWPTFCMQIMLKNFDIAIFDISGFDRDATYFSDYMYRENSTFNYAGYHTSLDWDNDLGTGKNEWFLQQNEVIMNQDDRIENYHDWQNYMMDKLLLVQPIFSWRQYIQTWNTLSGYNFSDGLLQSWGKMSWLDSHDGQANINEIVISDQGWSELNPLFQDDTASEFMSDALLDPLFWIDSDKSIQPHLAKGYELLNETHCRIYLREDIKWQSDPEGNFTDEYFDAEDVYFTLYTWRELSNDQQNYDWIEEMKIIDKYTIDLYIDGIDELYTDNINEPYSEFLNRLHVNVLPEHYLNQTQTLIGEPDIMHPSWFKFAKDCFGTGLFKRIDYIEEDQTILTINPDCWWLNTSITNDPNLNWVNRFGDFTGGLTQLHVRILNENLAKSEFEKGKIDISRISSTKPNINYQFDLQNNLANHLTFHYYNVRSNREYIGNTEPCTNDPSISKGLALRKAISYAINRDEINQVVHGGENQITDYPIYEANGIWCNPNIIRYYHDLGKAKYYMELTGFSETVITGFEFIELFYFIFIIPIFIITIQRKRQRVKEV